MLITQYLVCFILLSTAHSQKSVGDFCTLNSGVSGQCELSDNCEKAINDLHKYNIRPTLCGYQRNQAIVCCPLPSRTPGKISDEKCREYSKLVYETVFSPVALIEPRKITRNVCGHQVVKLIIGGEPAGRTEFPHMAMIGFEQPAGDWKWNCGGTILSDQYILTAAHCLRHRDEPAKRVRIGITNINSNSEYRQEFNVAKIIPHPEYRSFSHYHDIGLIKLDRPAKLGEYTIPACLYTKSNVEAQKAIATGWGATTPTGDSQSEDLLKVTLDFFDNDSCNKSYRHFYGTRKLRNGILDTMQLCASSHDPEASKDTCQGDSGGPLQIYREGDNITCMYDIVGVTSFAQPYCGGPLGVYTRVSHYLKWIEDTVWPPV